MTDFTFSIIQEMKRFLAVCRTEIKKNSQKNFSRSCSSNLERIKRDLETGQTSGKVYNNLKGTFDGTEAAVNAPRNLRQVQNMY